MTSINTFIFTILLSYSVLAAPTKVGNGDDGSDLEGFEKITSGKIVDARLKAVALLNKLNSPSIKHLGKLLPEVEKADLYITRKDISTEKLLKLGAFTNDDKGLVYARTFPVPHSPTRFFPAAKKLSEDQLITLHIHEALHRSLPSHVNENEMIIAEIALSITTPGANRDLIEGKINLLIPSPAPISATAPLTSVKKVVVPENARVKNPSLFEFSYKRYSLPEDETSFLTADPIVGMFNIKSHLYPFGENDTAVGIGIDLSLLNKENDSEMGPLGVNARWLAYTTRGFDFELFGMTTLNTLSNEELQNSMLGRDIFTLGVTISKKNELFYISNDLSITTSSEVEEEIGNVTYKYEFGSITGIKINAGAYYKALHIGGFIELLLSDNFKVTGGALDGEDAYETGRNRVFSVGPKISWKQKNFGLDVYGRFLIDSSQDTNYELLGNILEQGVGQGYIGSSMKFFF